MNAIERKERQWERANVAYRYYEDYLPKKVNRFILSLEDLLFVANFKGGNAMINDKQYDLEKKLEALSDALKKFAKQFNGMSLSDIKRNDLRSLQMAAQTFINSSKIKGFKHSRASALLHFYFPNLIPILDKLVVNGAGIAVVTNSNKLHDHYADLIKFFHKELLKDKSQTIRSIDKKLFSKPFLPFTKNNL